MLEEANNLLKKWAYGSQFNSKALSNPDNNFSCFISLPPYVYGIIFVKKKLKTYFIIINSNMIMQMA